jgi:hypothetical protein
MPCKQALPESFCRSKWPPHSPRDCKSPPPREKQSLPPPPSQDYAVLCSFHLTNLHIFSRRLVDRSTITTEKRVNCSDKNVRECPKNLAKSHLNMWSVHAGNPHDSCEFWVAYVGRLVAKARADSGFRVRVRGAKRLTWYAGLSESSCLTSS